MWSEIVRRYGISAIAGFLLGIAVATWAGPDTNAGIGAIIIVVMFLTIIAVEALRAVVGLVRRVRNQR